MDDRAAGFLASPYLSSGAPRRPGQRAAAVHAVRRAAGRLEALPAGGYQEFVAFAIRRLRGRLGAMDDPREDGIQRDTACCSPCARAAGPHGRNPRTARGPSCERRAPRLGHVGAEMPQGPDTWWAEPAPITAFAPAIVATGPRAPAARPTRRPGRRVPSR